MSWISVYRSYSIIQNICCSGDRRYYIVINSETHKSEIYYTDTLDIYNDVIDKLETPIENVKYIISGRDKRNGHQITIYASHNTIVKQENNSDLYEDILDLKSISSIYARRDKLYVLGK